MTDEASYLDRLGERRPWVGRARATRTGRLASKVLVGLVGGLVLVAGVIMIPLPGPGWLVVCGGLGILALEFAWAARLVGFVRATLARWTAWTGRQPLAVRGAVGAAGLVFVAAVAWASVRYTTGVDVVREADAWLRR